MINLSLILVLYPLNRGSCRGNTARSARLRPNRCNVEISFFRIMDEAQVVKVGRTLYEMLGGQVLAEAEQTLPWRRDENAGTSAVYQIMHGYHIMREGQGISITITENWAETHADDRLIASAFSVKACDSIDLHVSYKNGRLSCKFSGTKDAEALCAESLHKLGA